MTDAAYQRMKELMPTYREERGRKLLRRQLTNLF
jgi:hypothetical protein